MYTKFLNKKLILNNLTDCNFFEPASNREYWEKIKEAGESEMLEYGNYYDNYTFEPLYASLFREYTTKKDRANFEGKYFDRRTALLTYTFLEAIYNDEQYIDRVVDIIWMILEETTWSLPAHISLRETSDSLPYYKDPTLDLFAAETAATLSFVYAVLKDKIDAISKNITIRMKEVVYDRVIKNYLVNDDYWYMGFYGGSVNNWNPWINSNVLLSTAIFEKDNKTKTDVIYKVMVTLNNYFKQYPFDGACDEGPSYWFHAGMRALECIEIISKVTDGTIDIFNEEKIKNMAEYILKAYIYNNRVVNFADAPAILKADYGSLYKFGKILNNDKLISLAKYSYELNKKEELNVGRNITMAWRTYVRYDVKSDIEDLECSHKFMKEVYLPSVNFFAVRENDNSVNGLYLAAKGGHNGESHNHNDIGNFIVYKDSEPFLIDSGNMQYSALTFDSEYRYTLWTNVSEYHNLPTIGGKNQHEGKAYSATDVSYKSDESKTVFSLDIKNAYVNKDDINKWIRTIVFDKVKTKIEITEDYSLKKADTVTLNYLSHKPFVILENEISMTAENGVVLKMFINTADFDIETETIEIKDVLLKKSWGDKLYRMKLVLKEDKADNIIKYTLK